MSKPLFNAVMEDGSIIIGGNSYFETKWKEIPITKKIKRLFYLLPSGDYLALSGYDRYYHYVEVLQDISGKDKGNVRFQFACVLAEKENKVVEYKIYLTDKTVDYNIYNKNNEQVTKLNPNGWR